MSTLAQMRDTIKNSPDKGPQVRKKNIPDLLLEYWIKVVRNRLIGKGIEKQKSILATLEQDLGCWPLECVDQADCEGCGWKWGEDVKKAVFPRILELNEGAGLAFFGLIDKRTRIMIPSSNYGSLDDFMPFRAKNWIEGMMIGFDTIYIHGPKATRLKTVNIRGVFEDPTLVSYYSAQGEKYCYNKNTEQYPMPADDEIALYDMVFREFILPFVPLPKNTINSETNVAPV